MKTLIRRFGECESGATAIEYGLIAALIGVTIIVSLGEVSDALNTVFGKVKEELDTAAAGP